MREDEGSQTTKAIVTLREMILNDEFKAGDRIAEVTIAERAGVSRTPARMAIMRLAEEGLLEQRAGGGVFVASFTESDLFDAAEIRGALEGVAARLAAERGITQTTLYAMERCIAEFDIVFAAPTIDLARYRDLNARFHELMRDACDSSMVTRSISHINKLPFAAPNAFIRDMGIDVRNLLVASHEQHRSIVDAIRNRQGTRAEALAREHSLTARKISELAHRTSSSLDRSAFLKLALNTVGG